MAIKTANNQSMSAITALPSGVSAKSLILLATETASSSSTITFDSNIDSTYKEYIIKYIDIHPSAGDNHFTVNFRDGSTAYDATKTSSSFIAYHLEDGTSSTLGYDGDADLAQGTGVQRLSWNIGNENDENIGGYLHLYDPSSTTFVKHYVASTIYNNNNSYANNTYVAGYCNVTTAIDGVQFTMAAGTIDAGTFKLYGVN